MSRASYPLSSGLEPPLLLVGPCPLPPLPRAMGWKYAECGLSPLLDELCLLTEDPGTPSPDDTSNRMSPVGVHVGDGVLFVRFVYAYGCALLVRLRANTLCASSSELICLTCTPQSQPTVCLLFRTYSQNAMNYAPTHTWALTRPPTPMDAHTRTHHLRVNLTVPLLPR